MPTKPAPDGNVLLLYGGDYTVRCSCQTSQNHALKRMNVTVCKLSLDKSDIFLKNRVLSRGSLTLMQSEDHPMEGQARNLQTAPEHQGNTERIFQTGGE